MIGSIFTGSAVRKWKAAVWRTNMPPLSLPHNQLARNAFAARPRLAQRSAGRIFVIAGGSGSQYLFGIYAKVNAARGFSKRR
jgi:hypothetical protein